MNTATRVYARHYVAKKTALSHLLPRGLVMIFLIVALLASALTLVYTKDLNRRLFIQYQQLEHQKQQYHLQRDRLLLEQGALLNQLRVQQLAQKDLRMVFPSLKQIIFLRDK